MAQSPAQRPAQRKPSQKEIADYQKEKREQFLREEEIQMQQRRDAPPVETPIDKYVVIEYIAVGRQEQGPMVWNFLDRYADRWVQVTIGPNPPKSSPIALAPWQAVVPLCFIEGRMKGQPGSWHVVREVSHDEFSQARVVPVQAVGVVAPKPKANVSAQYDALPDDLGDIEAPPSISPDTDPDGNELPGDDIPTDISTLGNAPVI